MASILVAFRTAEGRRTIQAMLERAGHTVTLCRTGATAIAEARTGRAEVLIIDSRLPDLTPHEVCMILEPVLPVVVCGPVDAELQRRAEDGSGRVIRAVLVPASIRSALSTALTGAASSPAPAAESRVLLVEDDDSIAEPLVEGLARYGITASRVATGAEALAAPPAALVLLDLGLPDIDGIDVFWELRRAGDIPVIMLTARGDEESRVRGLELGADDYLTKPFSLRELVARIRTVGRRTLR